VSVFSGEVHFIYGVSLGDRVRYLVGIRALDSGGVVSSDDEVISRSAYQVSNPNCGCAADILGLRIVSARKSYIQFVASWVCAWIACRWVDVPSKRKAGEWRW